MEKQSCSNKGQPGLLIFLACLFLGAGIGYRMGMGDAGWSVGMGAGFLVLAFCRCVFSCKSFFSQITLWVLGIYFVLAPFYIAEGGTFQKIESWLEHFGYIALGVLLAIGGLVGWRKS